MTGNGESKVRQFLTGCLAAAALVGVYCFATIGVSSLLMTATDISAQAKGGHGHGGHACDTATVMAATATVMVDTATVMADTATVMVDTATVMVDTATVMVDTATVMAAFLAWPLVGLW